MISVRITCESAPILGRGRWTMPTHLMYDKQIMKYIREEGARLKEEMDKLDNAEQWDPSYNHQTTWAKFQNDFAKLARERCKIVVPKLTKEIAILETRINIISSDTTLTDEERSIYSSPQRGSSKTRKKPLQIHKSSG